MLLVRAPLLLALGLQLFFLVLFGVSLGAERKRAEHVSMSKVSLSYCSARAALIQSKGSVALQCEVGCSVSFRGFCTNPAWFVFVGLRSHSDSGSSVWL